MNNDLYKILIIDDDAFLSDMYSMKFSEAGHEIEVATNAEDATSLLKEGKQFDIILLDLVMPGTDGFEFLSSAKENDLIKDTDVIVLTNQSRDEDIEKAEGLGAKAYIVKASSVPSEVVSSVLEIKGSQSDKIIVKH